MSLLEARGADVSPARSGRQQNLFLCGARCCPVPLALLNGIALLFHHAIQNDVQCKTYELSISGIYHLIFQTVVDHR